MSVNTFQDLKRQLLQPIPILPSCAKHLLNEAKTIIPTGSIEILPPITSATATITFAPAILTKSKNLVTLEGTATMIVHVTAPISDPYITGQLLIDPPIGDLKHSTVVGFGLSYAQNVFQGAGLASKIDNKISIIGSFPNSAQIVIGDNTLVIFYSVEYLLSDSLICGGVGEGGGYGMIGSVGNHL